MPSVSEPFLAWTTSGEVDFQAARERSPLDHKPHSERFSLSHEGVCSSELLAGLSSVVDFAESAQADFQLAVRLRLIGSDASLEHIDSNIGH
jgi:hypothetical protein